MNEAEREFGRVAANDPQDYRSRNNLAGIYAAQGRTDAALAELRLTLTMRPSYAAGWQNLGILHVRPQNVQGAEIAPRNSVDLDQNDANGHFLLAQVLNSVGRRSKAADHLAIASKLDPGLARRIPGRSQERL
jgi:tetratricopeptide (TPR) repeat protein